VSEVGLTGEERRRLDEVAEGLARDHPHLARRLTRGRLRRLHRRQVASGLMIVAPPLIVLGVVALQALLVTIGCLALIAAVIIAAGERRGWRWSRRR
jgi:hypothetical protein